MVNAAKENNGAITCDISLMGFNDNFYFDNLPTPLTTIAHPVEKISEMAVNAITKPIDGKKNLNEWS